MTIPFRKMHGLGNDFVIIDARDGENPINADIARAMGDRHTGIGFDQLVVMHRGTDGAVVDIDFWNSDGTMAGACGNASRCIAHLMMQENQTNETSLRTERGLLMADQHSGRVRVNMGSPQLEWQNIPLASAQDTLHLQGDFIEGLAQPTAVNMGNPHCVFFVVNAKSIDLARYGRQIEHHPEYPERTNVEFCHVIDRQNIRMRVWERGGMITLACGSGACAAVVAGVRLGLIDKSCTVHLDGGKLDIEWTDEGIWMTGAVTHVFDGLFNPMTFPDV